MNSENVNSKNVKTPKKNVNKRQYVCINDTSTFNYREAGARPRTQQSRQPGAEELLTTQFLLLHQARARPTEEEATTSSAGSAGPSNSTRSDCISLAFRDTEDLPQRILQPAPHSRSLGTEQCGRQSSSQIHSSGRTEAVAARSEGRDAEDFPSLETLTNTAEIQQQVQARYAELEQANSQPKGTLETLVELFSKNVEKKPKDQFKHLWPQNHVYVGVHREKSCYNQLDECKLILGFLRQRQLATTTAVRENMIEYLIELLQDAVDFSWPVAKGAHFVLINRMIEGLVSWENLPAVHKIRERYAKSTQNQNIQQFPDSKHDNLVKFDRKRDPKPVPCFKFNKRTGCSEKQDHLHQNLLLRHACQLCHQLTGQFENHSKLTCPRNTHFGSKNA